jgi:hypothetical protein
MSRARGWVGLPGGHATEEGAQQAVGSVRPLLWRLLGGVGFADPDFSDDEEEGGGGGDGQEGADYA